MSEKAVEPEVDKNAVPQKEDLEREKLLLEIQQLKDPWWKKPAYMLAALPTLLAALSLIYGFANGYFQATAVKLENQKHDLQIEKDRLQTEVKEFTAKRDELNRQNKELLDIIEISKKQMEASDIWSNHHAMRLDRAEKENEELKKEIERLKKQR
jgi:hypothetical protein